MNTLAPRKPWLLLTAIALVPTLDALVRLGRLHPDEVFQTLEPAMQAAFGSSIVAWEWETGLRNWFVPGLFAGLLRAAHVVGLDDPLARRAVLAVPQFALTLAMVTSAYRFAERRVGARSARWSTSLLLTWAPWVWFSGRTMGESFSAALLVMAFERLDLEEHGQPLRRRDALAAGLLLGLAEVTRYGSAAFIFPALVSLAAHRRWSTLRDTMLGGAMVALALGLLDKLTWGHWFHSLVEYLRFNIFTGGSSSFGRLPVHWYLTELWAAPGLIIALGLIGWRTEKGSRAWLLAATTVTYFVAISVTEHKETRFLYPALVLALVATAPAAVQWASRTKAHLATAAVALVAPLLLFFVPTPFDIGHQDLIRATIEAGRTGTGVVLVNDSVWSSGGTFYLGKNLPLRAAQEPTDSDFMEAMADQQTNRAMLVLDLDDAARDAILKNALTAAGFHESTRVGDVQLFTRP